MSLSLSLSFPRDSLFFSSLTIVRSIDAGVSFNFSIAGNTVNRKSVSHYVVIQKEYQFRQLLLWHQPIIDPGYHILLWASQKGCQYFSSLVSWVKEGAYIYRWNHLCSLISFLKFGMFNKHCCFDFCASFVELNYSLTVSFIDTSFKCLVSSLDTIGCRNKSACNFFLETFAFIRKWVL